MGSKWGLASVAIPEGLATKLGKYGTLTLGLLAVFLEVSHVSLDKDATLALGGALVTLVTTMVGRMHQAAKVYESAPSPLQGATGVVNFLDDLLDGDDGPTVDPDLPSDPAVPPGVSS